MPPPTLQLRAADADFADMLQLIHAPYALFSHGGDVCHVAADATPVALFFDGADAAAAAARCCYAADDTYAPSPPRLHVTRYEHHVTPLPPYCHYFTLLPPPLLRRLLMSWRHGCLLMPMLMLMLLLLRAIFAGHAFSAADAITLRFSFSPPLLAIFASLSLRQFSPAITMPAYAIRDIISRYDYACCWLFTLFFVYKICHMLSCYKICHAIYAMLVYILIAIYAIRHTPCC